jgi:hypothetical protein
MIPEEPSRIRRLIPSCHTQTSSEHNSSQQTNGVFAVIAAIATEPVQDRLLFLPARLAITFPNCFKVFPRGTLYHIKASFSVIFNMAQRYFSEYLSITFI